MSALCGYFVRYPADAQLGTPPTWFRCNETGILRSAQPVRRAPELEAMVEDGRLALVRALDTGAAIYRLVEAVREVAR